MGLRYLLAIALTCIALSAQAGTTPPPSSGSGSGGSGGTTVTGTSGDIAGFNGSGALQDTGKLLSGFAPLVSPAFTGAPTFGGAALGSAAFRGTTATSGSLAAVTGSFTTGDLAVLNDTAGTLKDSGVLPGSLAPLASPAFTGSPTSGGYALLTTNSAVAASQLTGTLGPAIGGTGAANPTGYELFAGTNAPSFSATIPATSVSGLGTLATANAATPPAWGGTTPAAGSFTTLNTTGMLTVGNGLADYLTANGVAAGGTLPIVAAGSDTNIPVSVTTKGTGSFTLAASGSSGVKAIFKPDIGDGLNGYLILTGGGAGTSLYGLCTSLPISGVSCLGGYYKGQAVQGTTTGAGNPIFGVLSSSQTGNGLGFTALTV